MTWTHRFDRRARWTPGTQSAAQLRARFKSVFNPPKPKAPEPAPAITDPEIEARRKRERLLAARRRGLGATLLDREDEPFAGVRQTTLLGGG